MTTTTIHPQVIRPVRLTPIPPLANGDHLTRAEFEGEYQRLQPDEAGVLQSRCFPGLQLQADMYWADDLAGMLKLLQAGLATAEHEAFVETLQATLARSV